MSYPITISHFQKKAVRTRVYEKKHIDLPYTSISVYDSIILHTLPFCSRRVWIGGRMEGWNDAVASVKSEFRRTSRNTF